MALPVVVLAGGLGTRLGSHGNNTPKILVPINKTPFLDLQLNWLINHGVRDITYCIGHLGDKVVAHIKSLDLPSQVNIKFSWDGNSLRGTGGAIAQATNSIEGKFILTYGDSFLRADLSSIMKTYEKSSMSALMCVYKNMNRFDISNVEFFENKIVRYQKNNLGSNFEYIDYGILGFENICFSQFNHIPNFDLSKVIESLVDRNQLLGYEVHERFFEIGTVKGIRELEQYLNKNTMNLQDKI